MRDPNLLKSVEINNNDVDILVIAHLPEYDIEDYDLFNEKDFKKYIIDIEKTCRISFEYRQMIKYLRDNMDMNKCSFYQNVNNIDTFKIKIHIHHEPLTLYDICIVVYRKRLKHKESLDVELVAKEVMFLHYKLMVGLIPLAETPHELVHNQYLFVPADVVLGHYGKFIDMYEEFFDPEQLYVLNNILEATNVYNGEDTSILSKHFIYIDATGTYKLPALHVIQNILNTKINELKNSSIIKPEQQNYEQEEIIYPFKFI